MKNIQTYIYSQLFKGIYISYFPGNWTTDTVIQKGSAV